MTGSRHFAKQRDRNARRALRELEAEKAKAATNTPEVPTVDEDEDVTLIESAGEKKQ
jgi:hypothetical protein